MSRKPTTPTPSTLPAADWMNLAGQSWMLWGEAASVIWLRSLKLAGGGASARNEAVRMVSEKGRFASRTWHGDDDQPDAGPGSGNAGIVAALPLEGALEPQAPVEVMSA